jgi:radical SAM superfamily enzyme YgiQ (UPF0313 family)
MKILLLQIIDTHKTKLEIGYPHIGLAYIASFLKNEYPEIKIVIKNYTQFKDIIKEKPDIIGITSVTQNFEIAEKLIDEIYDTLKIPVILGGVHLTCVPDNLPKNTTAGILGEGEETFYELIKLYKENNNQFLKKYFKKIKGIIYWEDEKLVTTESRPSLKLDKISLPARNLLPKGSQVLFTSRGCPYNCKFCSSSAFWKNIRFFSPETVIKELEYILKLDPFTKNIIIYDDLFIADRKRLDKIAKLFSENSIVNNLRFWGNATANLLNDEVCSNLKKMNFDGISFGFETGNDSMLKWLKGNQASIEKNLRAINLCKKYGLESHGSFMLGLPNETEQQMRDTLNFIKNEKFDKGDILVATPLPGTVFWEIAIQQNLIEKNYRKWSKLAIRYSGWFPESDDFLLMTNKVSYKIFREIYDECAHELLKRTKKFDERRAMQFAKRTKFLDFFSTSNFARAINDPKRALLYLKKFLKYKIK